MQFGRYRNTDVNISTGADRSIITGADAISYHRPVQICCQKGYDNCLTLLIEARADVNQCYDRGNTAMMLATRLNHVKCVNLLIQAGANVNMANDDDFTALTFALTNKSEDCVAILIDAGADVNRYHPRHISPLILAIKLNVVKIVRKLLEAGANVNGQNANTASLVPLTTAVRLNHIDCLKLLIEAGAEVNGPQSGGRPLLAAAMTLRPACVMILLQAGADVNLKSKKGESPLLVVCSRPPRYPYVMTSSITCVKALLKFNVPVNVINEHGNNALSSHVMMYLRSRREKPDKTMVLLMCAACETLDDTSVRFGKKYLHHKDLSLNLKHLCREAIRKHLLEVDPHTHLFGRIPRIGLPPVLCQFLLYDQSLDMED